MTVTNRYGLLFFYVTLSPIYIETVLYVQNSIPIDFFPPIDFV